MQKITTFLWFDDNAKEAAEFYTSIFKKSKIVSTTKYGEGGPGPEGQVMSVIFELDGQQFYALNGGPHFHFTEAISLFVTCKDQEEVDYFWEKLSEGGVKQPCGWLKDKYGLSWQVAPERLNKMLQDKDPKRSKRVMDALMKMKKLDISALEEAYQ